MLDTAEKEEYRKLYSAYAKTKDETADAMGAVTDAIKAFAKKIEVKPGNILKAFANRYKKEETGVDSLAEVMQIVMEAEEVN